MRRLLLVLVLAGVPAFASAQSPDPYSAAPTQALMPPIIVFPGSANSVLAVDGVVGTPSIAFASEPTTGFWRAAAGDVRFSVSGSPQFRFVANNIVLKDAEALSWSSTSDPSSTADTTLARSAAGKIALTGTTPMLQLGGTTSSFPALVRNGTSIQALLADSSAYAFFQAHSFFVGANLLLSGNAPTISSGFGTSPSVASSNGSATFRVNVGTGGVATSGVIGLTAATTGWNCQVTDMTNNTVTRETASTTTTVTVTAAAAWAASDILIFNCAAY